MKLAHPITQIAVSLVIAASAFGKGGWEDNLEKGLAKAKTEKKIALVDFTGSDWCSWCMKLDKEVFAQAKFKDYAKQNLILIEVDFPQLRPLSRPKQKKNDELAKQYEVKGFPSVIILDSEGKKLGRLGYMEGGPDAFIAAIEKLKGAPPQ